jgi:hypothetical protein
MPRRLSGFKPTGHLHLGNYLGAIHPMVDTQHQVESVGSADPVESVGSADPVESVGSADPVVAADVSRPDGGRQNV